MVQLPQGTAECLAALHHHHQPQLPQGRALAAQGEEASKQHRKARGLRGRLRLDQGAREGLKTWTGVNAVNAVGHGLAGLASRSDRVRPQTILVDACMLCSQQDQVCTMVVCQGMRQQAARLDQHSRKEVAGCRADPAILPQLC